MNRETFEAVKTALSENSISSLFSEKIGVPEDVENEDQSAYALMFNIETNELFFLHYATAENSWAKTAEQQNPWICIGYISATDILMGDPAGYIESELLYKVEQQEQMDAEREKYGY